MKSFLFFVIVAIPFYSYSQSMDSLTVSSSDILSIKHDSTTGLPVLSVLPQPGMRQPVIVTRGNISLVTSNPNISLTETLLVQLESEECEALRKRDHFTLKRIWARDFTLDKKQNELVSSDNALSAYLSFGRVIERITTIDSTTVFTSGYEYFQEFKSDLNVTPATIRKYFHAWTKVNGVWKITSKR